MWGELGDVHLDTLRVGNAAGEQQKFCLGSQAPPKEQVWLLRDLTFCIPGEAPSSETLIASAPSGQAAGRGSS